MMMAVPIAIFPYHLCVEGFLNQLVRFLCSCLWVVYLPTLFITLISYHLQAAWLLGPKGCGPNLLITQASRDSSLGPNGSSLFTGSATTSTGSLFNVPASHVIRVTKHQQGGGQPQQGGPGMAGSSLAAASSAVTSSRGGPSLHQQQQQQEGGLSAVTGAGEEGGGRRWVELPIGTNAAGRAMAGLAAATIISAVPPVESSEVLPGAVVPAVLPSSTPDVLPFAPAEVLPSNGECGSERGSCALPSGLEHVIASVESGVLAGVGRGGSAGIQAARLSQIA